MATEIVQLKNENGTPIYPVTQGEAITMDNGKTLDKSFKDATDSLSATIATKTTELTNSINTAKSTLNTTINTALSDALKSFYPVGSIYLTVGTGTTGTSSPAQFFGGTWERIGAGYALWTASSGAGGTISAGLPNIKGKIEGLHQWQSKTAQDGVFKNSYLSANDTFPNSESNVNTKVKTLSFNANDGNSIYSDSCTTVQPPAYKVYAWRRTA